MKFIKTFERIKQQKKQRLLKKAKSDNKSKSLMDQLISGMYIIFLSKNYNWKINKHCDTLILGKIMLVKTIKQFDYDDKIIISNYVDINPVDFIMEVPLDIADIKIINKDKTVEFNIDNFKEILYITSSLKDAQIKFNELLNQQPFYDWEMNNNANKYNL